MLSVVENMHIISMKTAYTIILIQTITHSKQRFNDCMFPTYWTATTWSVMTVTRGGRGLMEPSPFLRTAHLRKINIKLQENKGRDWLQPIWPTFHACTKTVADIKATILLSAKRGVKVHSSVLLLLMLFPVVTRF